MIRARTNSWRVHSDCGSLNLVSVFQVTPIHRLANVPVKTAQVPADEDGVGRMQFRDDVARYPTLEESLRQV